MIKDIPRDTVKEQIKDIRLDTRKELILDTIKEQIRDTDEEGVFDRDQSRRTSPFRDDRRSTRACAITGGARPFAWSHRLRAPTASGGGGLQRLDRAAGCAAAATRGAPRADGGSASRCRRNTMNISARWRSSFKSMTSPAAEGAAGDPGDFARTGSTRGARDPAP